MHAVGQESPTRSHFQAMDELERAAPGTGLRTGWLDRTLGLRPATSAFQAAQVGGSGVSPAFAGPSPEPALGSVDAFQAVGRRQHHRPGPLAHRAERHPRRRALAGGGPRTLHARRGRQDVRA
ncbi:hypothetical protein GCM10025868_30100 [Angustibacter aerolatus]|uniref:Uncharacterized protein n=1 Tax=Angustibacter aerolatus TaxID=1162965 RepID=A0ABQ6JLV4_9ACTN|nr:hypothetical protein GCM10025868_30100 [Angustibacter aerolatus]